MVKNGQLQEADDLITKHTDFIRKVKIETAVESRARIIAKYPDLTSVDARVSLAEDINKAMNIENSPHAFTAEDLEGAYFFEPEKIIDEIGIDFSSLTLPIVVPKWFGSEEYATKLLGGEITTEFVQNLPGNAISSKLGKLNSHDDDFVTFAVNIKGTNTEWEDMGGIILTSPSEIERRVAHEAAHTEWNLFKVDDIISINPQFDPVHRDLLNEINAFNIETGLVNFRSDTWSSYVHKTLINFRREAEQVTLFDESIIAIKNVQKLTHEGYLTKHEMQDMLLESKNIGDFNNRASIILTGSSASSPTGASG